MSIARIDWRSVFAAMLRFGSNRLSDTYTTADQAGVALRMPPGSGYGSMVDALRMLQSMGDFFGWRPA